TAAGSGRGGGAGSVAIQAVVPPVGAQTRRQRERPARLGVSPELLERAAEAEERVVVRGRALHDGLELRRGLRVAPRVEVGAAERLADRGRLGVEITGPGERDGGGVIVAGLEQGGAAPEELVDVRHGGLV